MREYAFCARKDSLHTLDFDVVIAGSGVAGLYAALNLDEGLECALLNKQGPNESNSVYAQGGIASVILDSDSFDKHFEDTLKAGAGLCDHEAVSVLVKEGPENIKRLLELGVPFDRDHDNNLLVSTEGAHSVNRIVHCGGDATGFHVTNTLFDKVKERKNIEIFHNTAVCDILTDDGGRTAGVVAMAPDGEYIFLRAPNVILASGGIGRIYRNSTNAGSATGDGIAAAMRAGAKVKNMEFVQFHPTALIHPDMNMRYFLISEALRGEGAVLRNRKGEAFLKPVHPMADLAPRDIVSRAIISEMKKNDLPNVYLDITSRPRSFLRQRFPIIYQECMRRGIDIAVNWIPVVPVQHYFMGGVETDTFGRTNVEGLYVCGESACTGVHGANRLASNSLLECLVFGRRSAEDISGSLSIGRGNPVVESAPKKRDETFDYETCRSQIRDNMTKKGGIIRNAAELGEAIELAQGYKERLSSLQLITRAEIETYNMVTVALEILRAALQREKSIGAHFRSDEKE